MRVAARTGWLVLILLGVLACACTARAATTPETAVVDAFLAARQARDLDAALKVFADEPEIRTNLGVTWSGQIAVRALLAYRLEDSYTVGERHVSGDRVTWTEHVRRKAIGAPLASFDEDVEATVVNGRIQRLITYAGNARPSLGAAEVAAPPQPVSVLLVPLSLGVLMLAVVVWPTRPQPAAGGGQLLNGLREFVERRG